MNCCGLKRGMARIFLSTGPVQQDLVIYLAVCLDAEGFQIFKKIREAAVEGEALGRLPTGKFRDFVFHGKTQGQFQRGEADAGRHGLRIELLAEKNVGKCAFLIKVGMGVDKVAEFFGLETAAAITHPVDSRFEAPLLPRGTDVVIAEKGGIPEVEVHGKPICLNVE